MLRWFACLAAVCVLLALNPAVGSSSSVGGHAAALTPLVPSNFYSAISSERIMLVYFHAPW